MIQAIETHYKGYRFRSRLEARWAVFFDALEVPWRYELQGVVTSKGECYLPDFLVGLGGAGHTWFEVKPYIFDRSGYTPEVKKTLKAMTELCYMPVDGITTDGFCGYITGGDPGPTSLGVLAIPMFHDGTMGEHKSPVTGAVTGCYAVLSLCPCCNRLTFCVAPTKDDTRWQVVCGCIDPERANVYLKPKQASAFIHHPTIVEAYTSARSARFEHGETPRILRGRQNA